HLVARAMQAVNVETAKLQPVVQRTAFIPPSHRLQEMGEFDISPHPAREVDEGAVFAPDAVLANEAIEFGGVGPVGFKGENAEPVALDQTMGNGRARLVELRGSVGRLSEQDDFGVREYIE